MDNRTKEIIVNRLHEMCGVRSHNTNTDLPPMLNTGKVLKAINLDEYFYPETDKNDELIKLRLFRDKAFEAHPNIDLDIENLAP